MYKRILVPIDGSQTSEKALDHAADLAALAGAEMRILHILDPLLYCNGFERPEIYVRQSLPAMRRAGHRLLEQARARVQQRGVRCDCDLEQCESQHVSEMIVNEAGHWRADLIVMGTHGRRGINRLLMGSDAEAVARSSPVPVLLVRPEGPVRHG